MNEPPTVSIEERTNLDEGVVVLYLPKEIGAESVSEFEYWMNGLLRKLRRKAGLKPKDIVAPEKT